MNTKTDRQTLRQNHQRTRGLKLSQPANQASEEGEPSEPANQLTNQTNRQAPKWAYSGLEYGLYR